MSSNITFALVDLQDSTANRDHDGGFGSKMHATGISGQIVTYLKKKLINIPILHFGFLQAIIRQSGNTANYYESDSNGEDIILIASSMHCYKEEIEYAKKQKIMYPKSKIGFFGPFCKTNSSFFEKDADFLIFDEVEKTIILFLQEKFQLKGVLSHGILQNLEVLPIPDWAGMPVEKYSYFPLLHKKNVLTIQTTRGCSFNCDYCPYMVSQTSNFRMRDPNTIVDEIQSLIKAHNVESILFRDLVFTFNRQHVIDICNEIKRRKVIIEWACETRLDLLDKELIDIMKNSGFVGINLGVETGNFDLLKFSGKKTKDLDEQITTIAYLKSKGIGINVFYILGLLNDTPKTMQETINFSHSLNTLGAQFTVLTPFPGTPLFDKLKQNLTITDYTKFDQFTPVVDIKTSTEKDIVNAMKRAYGYYLRISWIKVYGVVVVKKLFHTLLPKYKT